MSSGRSSNEQPVVALRGVTKRYGRGRAAVTALDAVDLALGDGSFTAVMGPSGSGKSTLLQCAAGLDVPDSGEVWLGQVAISRLGEPARARLRRRELGVVFQNFNLVDALSAADNVGLPARLAGRRPSRRQVREALERVGMTDRARHRPSELSGGQQQRVAIARALAIEPRVLFADEPTGALDSSNAARVLELLRLACDSAGQTVVMVTHDPVAAAFADRVVFLADGRVAGDGRALSAAEIAARVTELETGS